MTMKKFFNLKFALSSLVLSLILLPAIVLPFSAQALADTHVIHPGGLFNFYLKSDSWFESPLNEKFFFNIAPEMTMLLESEERNVFMSVSKLDEKTYTTDLETAYGKLLDMINQDSDNVVFLKHAYSYNDVDFKEIIYKDKNDLSNFRMILAKDAKKDALTAKQTHMIMFYLPKKSDFSESEDDVNRLLRTFKFKTELPEVKNEQLLGKGADCIGEFISLYETEQGGVRYKIRDQFTPVYKDYLLKFNSILETRGGLTSFKFNDGTIGLVNKNSRVEFMSMAAIKLETGQMLFKTQQMSGTVTAMLGNFIKMSAQKGEFMLTIAPAAGSNNNVVKVSVIDGSCNFTYEGEAAKNGAVKQLQAGKEAVFEINDLGKISSAKTADADVKALKSQSPWLKSIITHKIFEGISYLEKVREYDK